MARLHGIAVLFAIAGGTALWFALSTGDEVAPPLPPSSDRPAGPRPTHAVPTDDARAVVPPAAADAAVPGPTADQPTTPTPAAAPTPTAVAANVELLVRDLVRKQPVVAFRWTFHPLGGAPMHGHTTADPITTAVAPAPGRADLELPPATRGELQVEAEGLAAHAVTIAVPRRLAAPLQVEVFLAPLPTEAGVVLAARDQRGQPIERLRIDLWSLRPTMPPVAPDCDPEHDPLWQRSGSAGDGTFVLPSLVAGSYALRAQPIDADDVALPLQPVRRQFAFAGNEAVPFDCVFVPGIVLEVTAEAGLELQLAATVATRAATVPVWWRSRTTAGPPRVGKDTLVLPGRATSLLALPIGDYDLSLRSGDVPMVLQPQAATDGVRTFRAILPR